MEQYLQSLVGVSSEHIARLEKICEDEHIPNIQPLAAHLIRTLLQVRPIKRILEIGTAYGYSALHWCEAAPLAELVTIELDASRAARARQTFAEAHVASRVQLLEGDAGQLVPHLAGLFDVVFIDAAKGQYRLFLDEALKKVPIGGLIITDNVLFRGLVAQNEQEDEQIEKKHRNLVRKIREYNQYIVNHPQCSTSIVPIGDGLAITVKCKERSDY